MDHLGKVISNPLQNPLLAQSSQFMNMNDYLMPNMMAQFAMNGNSAMQSAYYNNGIF